MSETTDAIVNAINDLRARVEALEGNPKVSYTRNKWLHYDAKPYLGVMKEWDEKTRYKLTARELQIVYLKSQGFTNQQIADEACIALSTVKFHMTSIHRMLSTHSAAELMAYIFHNLATNNQQQEQP